MSRRKLHPQPNAYGQPVRVDDTLVRNHRIRERVHKLVASKRAQNLSVEEARAMAVRIEKKGPQAIQALFECLFEEENPDKHRMAVMLLSEIKDPIVFEKIHALLQRPKMPEKVRVALLAIEALHDGAADDVSVPSGLLGMSLESVLQFTENFWDAMETEEIAMMWRENFIAEPPEDRLAMLDMLLKSAHPKMLGIARVEIMVGDVKILQFLAQKLAEFDSPTVTRMLEALLEHHDLVVRTLADASLNKMRERAAEKRVEAKEKRLEKSTDILPTKDTAETIAAPGPPRFYRAYMATDEWSGHYSVVYAVRYPPEDLIKFAVFLLDRWDRGIIDCWGCVRYSDQEFEQLLATMAKDFADLRQEQIAKRTALTLLTKASDLNLDREHPLPLEYAIWSPLFENEDFAHDPGVPEFGVDCGFCHKPIRTGPRVSPPWVFGDLIVCHRCSKRSLRCPSCGGSTTLGQCLLTREDTDAWIDLRCPHCFESFRVPG